MGRLRSHPFSIMTKLSLRHISSSACLHGSKDKVSYSKTLILPKTKFSPKIPNADDRQRLIAESSQKVYEWQRKRGSYSQDFTLHDGPPYANGDLHLGHSLNKILKDIMNRFEVIHENSKVHYTPGWDCHGLPIEMKAIRNSDNLNAVEIRQRCRELAETMIEKQRDQFKEFAIMTDFDNYYTTMSHKYEKSQLQVFLKLFQNGLLSRQLKPVWWGCETQTALAEAELEYKADHKSVAIFVKFPLENSDLVRRLGGSVSVLIWTSTPWTIPANKAICINRAFTYTTLKDVKTGEKVLVALDLADSLLKENPQYSPTSDRVDGSDLEGLYYSNPSFQNGEMFPILHGDHVSSTAGTGLVHNAPAHGMEDYVIGKNNGLSVMSSVDEKGCYISSYLPDGFQELSGKYANSNTSIKKVLEILESFGMLFSSNKNYTHSYPYDWRSKTPVIQRATPQWFVNVDKIKGLAEQSLNKVTFVPESGRNRLSAFVKNRSEWCISRQRVWGVPLPIVYNRDTHKPLEDYEVIEHIVQKLGDYGTDEWFTKESDISRWLPSYIDGKKFYKGKDTMDVWFDSGTSWTTLSDNFKGSTTEPLADVYLEGSDQHRGWFQSSLLNKIIASGNGTSFQGVAPFKKVVTHGFILDNLKNKMSKSKGNVISPIQIINGGGKPLIAAMGTDGLRLWVASSNYSQDVSVNQEVLKRVFENVKKLRVTFKFLLGNLQGYKGAVSYDQLSPLDRWVLSRLSKLENKVTDAYTKHNYARVVREINNHMAGDLSSLYFDISKDCLYTDSADSKRRRGVQTVLFQVLKTYIGLLAPIQPILTQEVWDSIDFDMKPEGAFSPFVPTWDFFSVPVEYSNSNLEEDMEIIWKVRESFFKTIDSLRMNHQFKNTLEAEVTIHCDKEVYEVIVKHQDYFDDYLLVSKVTLLPSEEGEVSKNSDRSFAVEGVRGMIRGEITLSKSCKCPRCWKYTAAAEGDLCKKCTTVTCK